MSSSARAAASDLSALLQDVTAQKLFQIKRRIEKKEGAGHLSGAFKRKVRETLEPYKNVYDKLEVEAEDGGTRVSFYAARLSTLLTVLCAEAPDFKQRLMYVKTQCPMLHLFLSGDETTGGNVLRVSSNKKVFFFYVAIVETGELQRPDAWLPFAAVPSRDCSMVAGGVSAIGCALESSSMAN